MNTTTIETTSECAGCGLEFSGYESCPNCTVPANTDVDGINLDEELDAEDIAEIEAVKAQWEREELERCKKVVTQSNRDFKESLIARGLDIRDHILDDPNLVGRAAEREAARAGFRGNFDSPKNVQRRQKEREKAIHRGAAASRAAVVIASQSDDKPVTAKVEKPKAVKAVPVKTEVDSDLPAIPATTDRQTLAEWAREYCRALCEKYQSVKLQHKLFGKPENPGGGSLNWQIAAIPENDGALMSWAESARLSFDKKVSC